MGNQIILVEVFTVRRYHHARRGNTARHAVYVGRKCCRHKKRSIKKANKKAQVIDNDTSIEIDDTGIRIRKANSNGKGKQIEIDENGIRTKSDIDLTSGGNTSPTPEAPGVPATSHACNTRSTSNTGNTCCN
jgi:hypothetical protein